MKLIIKLDEALIEANPQAKAGRDEHNQDYSANKRVNGAISTDVPNEYKAVIGQAKAKLANRRANRAAKANTRRGERKAKQKAKKGKIRQAKYGNKNKSDNKDDNKGRGENNFRLWEITKSYRGEYK